MKHIRILLIFCMLHPSATIACGKECNDAVRAFFPTVKDKASKLSYESILAPMLEAANISPELSTSAQEFALELGREGVCTATEQKAKDIVKDSLKAIGVNNLNDSVGVITKLAQKACTKTPAN